MQPKIEMRRMTPMATQTPMTIPLWLSIQLPISFPTSDPVQRP